MQWNLIGSNIPTLSNKSVFFGPNGKPRWSPQPLIGWDLFDFFSETVEWNSTKLERRQIPGTQHPPPRLCFRQISISIYFITKRGTRVHHCCSLGLLFCLRFEIKEHGSCENLWEALHSSQELHIAGVLSIPNANKNCNSILKGTCSRLGLMFVYKNYLTWNSNRILTEIPPKMYRNTSKSKTEVPRDVRNSKVRKQDKHRRDWSQH